jgi:hypothetical protein
MSMTSRNLRTAHRSLRLIAAAFLVSALAASATRAQENAATDDSALARRVTGAHVSLARGLAAASARGKPISGKFELENGELQLSVYTARANRFWEVVVDHRTARIAKAEEIKEGEDLTAAKAQSEAMSKAKSLSAALTRALRTNRGYHAVSVTPAVDNGRPVATIRLVQGSSFKTVSESLE